MIQTKITTYLNTNSSITFNNKKRKIREDDELETGLVKRINKLNLKQTNSEVDTIKNKITKDYIVYKHSDIDFIYNVKNDSYSVVANKYIPTGTLLIVENAIIGTNEYIYTVLNNRKELMKELYPRNSSDSYNFIQKEKVMDKITHNVWEWNDSNSPISLEDMSALCPAISKFNHSCKPNAFVRCFSNKEEENNDKKEYKGYIFLYSVDNILENTEITVSYGFNIGHSYIKSDESDIYEDLLYSSEEENEVFNWICKCGKSKKERFSYFRNAYKEAKQYWTEDKEILLSLVKLE